MQPQPQTAMLLVADMQPHALSADAIAYNAASSAMQPQPQTAMPLVADLQPHDLPSGVIAYSAGSGSSAMGQQPYIAMPSITDILHMQAQAESEIEARAWRQESACPVTGWENWVWAPPRRAWRPLPRGHHGPDQDSSGDMSPASGSDSDPERCGDRSPGGTWYGEPPRKWIGLQWDYDRADQSNTHTQ